MTSKAVRAVGWIVTGLAGLALGTLLWSAPDWLIDRLEAWRPGCVYRARVRAAPLVALTSDDRPGPTSPPLILTELRQHGAHATFFLISGRLAGREQLVRD